MVFKTKLEIHEEMNRNLQRLECIDGLKDCRTKKYSFGRKGSEGLKL